MLLQQQHCPFILDMVFYLFFRTIVPLAFQLFGVVAGALERGRDPVGIAKQTKRTRQSEDAQQTKGLCCAIQMVVNNKKAQREFTRYFMNEIPNASDACFLGAQMPFILFSFHIQNSLRAMRVYSSVSESFLLTMTSHDSTIYMQTVQPSLDKQTREMMMCYSV